MISDTLFFSVADSVSLLFKSSSSATRLCTYWYSPCVFAVKSFEDSASSLDDATTLSYPLFKVSNAISASVFSFSNETVYAIVAAVSPANAVMMIPTGFAFMAAFSAHCDMVAPSFAVL